jgi:hypothetical protein
VKEEGEEHHPITAWGLRDPFGARELDGVTAGDEVVRPGLLQLLLHEGRGHLASCGVCCFSLGHVVFRHQVLHAHLQIRTWGLCMRGTGCKD